jgi:hypothetical protein
MSSKQRRRFDAQQKAQIVRRHLSGKVPISDLADEFGVQPSQIHTWATNGDVGPRYLLSIPAAIAPNSTPLRWLSKIRLRGQTAHADETERDDDAGDDRSLLNVHVCDLKSQIAPQAPELIHCRRLFGWRLLVGSLAEKPPEPTRLSKL